MQQRSFWQNLRQDKCGCGALGLVAFYLLLSLGVAWQGWGAGWDLLCPEGSYSPCSPRHWLGTNFNGQDIFLRALYSTKTAFLVGSVVAFGATVTGAALGLLAGYYQASWIDHAITWLFSCLDCLPFYLLLAALTFVFKDSDITLYLALITTLWTNSCKTLRAQTLLLRQKDFVDAARALGLSDGRILVHHILPSALPSIAVEFSLAFVTAIKAEAVLAFLGLGIKQGVSWGLMLAEAASEVLIGEYHNLLAASLFMSGLIIAVNFSVDAIENAVHKN